MVVWNTWDENRLAWSRAPRSDKHILMTRYCQRSSQITFVRSGWLLRLFKVQMPLNLIIFIARFLFTCS